MVGGADEGGRFDMMMGAGEIQLRITNDQLRIVGGGLLCNALCASRPRQCRGFNALGAVGRYAAIGRR